MLFGIGAPLWGFRNSLAAFVSKNIQLLQSKSALIAENDALKAQIQNDQENELLAVALKDENADLTNLLNRMTDGRKEILAAILIKPPFSPYDTLLIDIGSADGVSVGDRVLAYGNVYIGSVAEISDHASKVVLYSSSGEQVKVLVGAGKIMEQATGMGGGNFTLSMPVGSDVRVGDPIVVPSISPNIFGTVEKIESKPSDSFETILFKTPVNVSELAWVLVEPSGGKNKN